MIRDEYNKTRDELKQILQIWEKQIQESSDELSNLKQHYSEEMESLKHEVISLQSSIKSSKSLYEQQLQEYETAQRTNQSLHSEQQQLESELSDIEKRGMRATKENEDLWEKIMKLDKLVYGKTKSPYKKFYM